MEMEYSWTDGKKATSILKPREKEEINKPGPYWMGPWAQLRVFFNGKLIKRPSQENSDYTDANSLALLLRKTAPGLISFGFDRHLINWDDQFPDGLGWSFTRKKGRVTFGLHIHSPSMIEITEDEPFFTTTITVAEFTQAMFSLYDRFVKEILAINPRLAEHERFKPIIEARDALSKRLKELKQTRARDE